MADPGPLTAPVRTLAIVHNNIDQASSIGAIARWQVQEALDRDWQVVAVCRDLDPEFVGHVQHVPLYVPPRLHLVQWSVARATVRAALRGVAYDVLMVHQPQLAGIADLWNVHYLSRAARDVRVPPGPGWRSRVQDVQAAGVAHLEDRYLSRVPRSTRVLFCSTTIRDDFIRLYGEHSNSSTIPHPALTAAESPPIDGALPDHARRRQVTGGHPGPVVGFLGGGDPRKGGDLLVAAVAAEPELFLVHAGSPGLDTSDPRVSGRHQDLGHLADVSDLLDVIDVLVVPSRFEPFGLVAVEAAARGVPVLATPAVGALPLLVAAGAGDTWHPGSPLSPAVADMIERRGDIGRAGRAVAATLASGRVADLLFAEIETVWRTKERTV